jgi:hypothetical protein
VLLVSLAACGEQRAGGGEGRSAQEPVAAPAGPDEVVDLTGFELTVEQLMAWKAATAKLEALAPAEHEVAESVAEIVSRLEADEDTMAAIESEGLEARDYVMITLALLQAKYVLAATRQGLADGPPPGMPPGNVALVEEFETDLADLGSEAW